MTLRRSISFVLTILTLVMLGACGRGSPKHLTPTCAVQDCATGKIVDDGCAVDGRCMSCVNACPLK